MSNTETSPDATHNAEQAASEATTLETEADAVEDDTEAETFPRKVVEDLRRESAGYRDRAKTAEVRADELARALFTARVEATGKLADATDLDYNADIVDSPEAIAAAIDALIEAKPHVKARRLSGDVGQGQRGNPATAPSFAAMLNSTTSR